MSVGIRAEETLKDKKYAYAVMDCRKLVENYLNEILKKQNISLTKANGYKKDLSEKCDDLEKTGLSDKMQRALKKIRLEGNDAVHDLDDPTPEEALRVLQYTYDFVSISFDWYFAENNKFKQQTFNSQTTTSGTTQHSTPRPSQTSPKTEQTTKRSTPPPPPKTPDPFDHHWQWWLGLNKNLQYALVTHLGYSLDYSVFADKTIMKPRVEQIVNLTKITISNDYVNAISDLQNLSNVKEVTLLGNGNGTGKEIAFLGLQKLLKLETLIINGAEDISYLKHLTNLRELGFGISRIKDISPLKNLTKLERLNLHSNQISDISPLKNLTNLRYLDLHNNPISDISPLKNLINLKELVLTYEGNSFSHLLLGYRNLIKYISPLEKMKSLRKLRLDCHLTYEERLKLEKYLQSIGIELVR